jgi:hypothetical protein
MNSVTNLEHRASSRLSKHEGESSFALCDRLDRTRANSQRQLPTDHDYAVPTREYQTDQSSLITAQAAARSVLAERRRQPQNPTIRGVDRVTPYQGKALIEHNLRRPVRIGVDKRGSDPLLRPCPARLRR